MSSNDEATTIDDPAVALFKQRVSGLSTDEGRLKGLDFVPGPRDVAISTTPKAGTTWMQQICHQLRSKGDMSFLEISEVVPWLELAHDQGQDLTSPQSIGENKTTSDNDGDGGELRFFKTHAWADHCPNFKQTIVVVRDPCDVLVSFYKFLEGWIFEPGTLSMETFATEFWLKRGVPDETRLHNASYFVHLVSWYKKQREKDGDDNGVLMLCFEDLKDDLAGQVQKVAKFLSRMDARYVEEPERVEIAISHSTFQFMKEHEGHFDEKLSKMARNEAFGLPKDAGRRSSGKVNTGQSGKGKLQLSESVLQQIDEKWKQIVLPVTGCASYQELRDHIRKRE